MANLVDFTQLPLPDVYQIVDNLEQEKFIIKARKKDRQVILPSSKINVLTLNQLLYHMDLPHHLAEQLVVVNNAEQEMEILDYWYKNSENRLRTLTEIFVTDDKSAKQKNDITQLTASED